ncbi:hypothetical protein ACF0H5_018880 [Mactra antiquata]
MKIRRTVAIQIQESSNFKTFQNATEASTSSRHAGVMHQPAKNLAFGNRMMTSSRVSQQRNLDVGRHCEVPNEILVKTREDEGEKVGHINDTKQARNRMMTSSRVSQQRNLDVGRHCEVPNEILVKTREDEGEKVGHSNDTKQARKRMYGIPFPPTIICICGRTSVNYEAIYVEVQIDEQEQNDDFQ